MVFFKWYSLSKWYFPGGAPTSVGTTQPGGSQGPSSLDLAMSESAKPKGAGGSAKGARHSSLAVALWRSGALF
jgi:hypothetical protein